MITKFESKTKCHWNYRVVVLLFDIHLLVSYLIQEASIKYLQAMFCLLISRNHLPMFLKSVNTHYIGVFKIECKFQVIFMVDQSLQWWSKVRSHYIHIYRNTTIYSKIQNYFHDCITRRHKQVLMINSIKFLNAQWTFYLLFCIFYLRTIKIKAFDTIIL